jgi:RNA polymerase sigma-70 factor (ECF subfamily)
LQEKRDKAADVAAFLTGEPAIHAEMRQAIALVVGGFRFGVSTTEELIQETLCRLFISLRSGSYRGEASLRTFGQRIAEYTCLEHLRRARFRTEVDPVHMREPLEANTPDTDLLRAEEHRRNLSRLAAMSAECRALFGLIFIERLSYVEVGKRLGISETAVKLRVHRCRLTARLSAAEESADRRARRHSVDS